MTRRWLGALACVAGLVLAVWSGSGIAVSQTVPSSREQIQLSFSPLVKQVGPAVVNIYTRTVVSERRVSPLFDDPFFRRFFGDLTPGAPRQRTQQSLGSGVILDPSGLVVTNAHVIENAQEIKVVLNDRREFDAEMVIVDERTDLAVLRIDAGGVDLPSIELAEADDLEVGDLVIAIGNPFGVGQTVTSGIVSALARTALGITDYSFFIQTDAAINPGNSGGALVDMSGRLVGVNTAIFSNRSEGSSGGSIGIGFAIPADMVRTILASAKGGSLVRPWLGVAGQTVTADLAREFGLDRPVGVLVTAVHPASVAAEIGLRVSDIILEIADHEVMDERALRYRVATRGIGERIGIKYLRAGRVVESVVEMRAAPAVPDPDVQELSGQHPFDGSVVANLSPAFCIENGLDPMATGVILVRLRRGGVAARLGLRPKDVILSVNDDKVETVSDLKRMISSPQPLWRLSIRRGDKVLNTEIRG